MIEFRPANGTEQHCIARKASVDGFIWKRAAGRPNGATTDQMFMELERVTVTMPDGLQDPRSFGDDFRTYAIAGQNRDSEFHSN